MLRDLKEIWQQNQITSGADRAATVYSMLMGDSLSAFETALEDQVGQEDHDGNQDPLSQETVQKALDIVTTIDFPHRSLEIQKLWMQRGMKKLFGLSTRKWQQPLLGLTIRSLFSQVPQRPPNSVLKRL